MAQYCLVISLFQTSVNRPILWDKLVCVFVLMQVFIILTIFITAYVAKVMFSQACVTHSVQLGGGDVTSNASWDRSHGQGEVVLSLGGGIHLFPLPRVKGQPPPSPCPGSKVNHPQARRGHWLPTPPTYGPYGLCARGRYASYWNAFFL